jgi:hypothetical protein
MAAVAAPRTFKLTSPHITGPDVSDFQRALNKRFEAWKINRRVVEDGDYGTDTRKAARQVCRGLGIKVEPAMRHGATPELRGKIVDPKLRTLEEVARAKSSTAKAFRAQLRKQFKGAVSFGPNANLPGQPMADVTVDYVKRMAALLHKPIVITTGTNHSKFTTTGSISDHFTGHAADIGMAANGGIDDSPVGDRIMTVALRVAGVPAAEALAKARAGGLFNFVHDGLRIQCIWKTDIGGNHHNHVHVGVRPA